jgi:hypothetical protein
VIEGIADDAKEVSLEPAMLTATSPRKLGPGETVVDIVLARTGSIDSTVGHARDHIVRVVATSASGDDMFSGTSRPAVFHIDRLPAGGTSNCTVRRDAARRSKPTSLHVTFGSASRSSSCADCTPTAPSIRTRLA